MQARPTAIASISDIEPIRTDEDASDMTTRRKKNTTVAMDYGMIRVGPGEKVHLYGTPGQERFDFMWEILTKGGIGLVLLLDNTRPAPRSRIMRFYVKAPSSDFIDGHAPGDRRDPDGQHALRRRPSTTTPAQTEGDGPGRAGLRGRRAPAATDVSSLIQALLLQIDPTL